MNSSNLITRAGSNEIIKLKVPTPIRTPLSKWVLDVSDSQVRLFRIVLHSLKDIKRCHRLLSHNFSCVKQKLKQIDWCREMLLSEHILVAVETGTNFDASFDEAGQRFVFNEC